MHGKIVPSVFTIYLEVLRVVRFFTEVKYPKTKLNTVLFVPFQDLSLQTLFKSPCSICFTSDNNFLLRQGFPIMSSANNAQAFSGILGENS